MPTFTVVVNVKEIVDGLKGLAGELGNKYLLYIVIGLSILLVAIAIASCLGAVCALCCYNTCCRRRRRSCGARRKTYIRGEHFQFEEESITSRRSFSI